MSTKTETPQRIPYAVLAKAAGDRARVIGAMATDDRVATYVAQNRRTDLTPRQMRRAYKKCGNPVVVGVALGKIQRQRIERSA